jgi:hypothetical protein
MNHRHQPLLNHKHIYCVDKVKNKESDIDESDHEPEMKGGYCGSGTYPSVNSLLSGIKLKNRIV